MYNGVKAMIEKEKSLAPASLVCGPNLKTPADITGFPTFPPGTKSLLSKYLTKDIWNNLQD
jgi:hypothetical protein